MSLNENKSLKEQLYEVEKLLNKLGTIEKIRPNINIKLKHYVLEYWHLDKENFEEVGKWSQNALIKSRDTYQLMEPVYAFQFYDLINIEINGEYIEGVKKHNVSPLIYVGNREYIDDNLSIIIDKDGDYHSGKSGITYLEYLNSINKVDDNKLKREKKHN